MDRGFQAYSIMLQDIVPSVDPVDWAELEHKMISTSAVRLSVESEYEFSVTFRDKMLKSDLPPPAIVPQLILMIGSLSIIFETFRVAI